MLYFISAVNVKQLRGVQGALFANVGAICQGPGVCLDHPMRRRALLGDPQARRYMYTLFKDTHVETHGFLSKPVGDTPFWETRLAPHVETHGF